jgi:hypothetical protein
MIKVRSSQGVAVQNSGGDINALRTLLKDRDTFFSRADVRSLSSMMRAYHYARENGHMNEFVSLLFMLIGKPEHPDYERKLHAISSVFPEVYDWSRFKQDVAETEVLSSARVTNTIRLRSVYDRLGNQGDRILIKDSRKHVADISYHGGKFVVGIIGYKQWIVDGSDINAAYDTLEMKLEEYFRNNHIRVNVEIERTDLPSSVYKLHDS